MSFNANLARNSFRAGLYSFYQQNREQFGAIFNDGSGSAFLDSGQWQSGRIFHRRQIQTVSHSSSLGGMQPTHFRRAASQKMRSVRFGAALNVSAPQLDVRAWRLLSRTLVTASDLCSICAIKRLWFLPLQGERDEEHQFGVTIPFRGWTLDADNFQTNAHNFFDHDVIGESNLFFPLTIEHAFINGWEVTLRSPRIANRARIHLAYSNQTAQAGGAITGGLTDFSVLDFGPLDHDQRNTLNVGGDIALPSRSFASTNVYYGSGFTNAFSGQPILALTCRRTRHSTFHWERILASAFLPRSMHSTSPIVASNWTTA